MMGNKNPHKRYLGDSVYIDYDGIHFILTTDNGLGPTNTIYLELETLRELEQYIKERRSRSHASW